MTTLRAQGDKLARLRRALGYSQLQLAIRAGVSERTVRNAECGHSVKRDFLEYIACGLQVSLFEVLEDEFEYDSKWLVRTDALQGELKDALSALQPDVRLDADLPAIGTRTIGAKLLDALLIQMHRQGFSLRDFVRSNRGCSCRMTFDAPLRNPSTVLVRGRIYAASQTLEKTVRWVLFCATSGADIQSAEAFCDVSEPQNEVL